MADGRVQLCDQEVLLDLELTTLAGLSIDVEQHLAQLVGPSLLDDEVDEFSVGDDTPELQADPGCPDSLTQLIDRAVANGLPSEHVGTLLEIIEAHPDFRRESVGPDPPANVEPLLITLKTDAVPYRSPPRKYAPLQDHFIRNYVKMLEVSGLTQGFWQMDLDEASREMFSFVTPEEDDVILFVPIMVEFPETLRVFFEIVRDANIKLNMAKSSLFEFEILWNVATTWIPAKEAVFASVVVGR
ncbi:hypothetical protein PF003_g22018 [Phytophthora fragariae]|nr:hypothetical protein PF003_g22018 [Phytophthora fragariae]